MATPHNRAENKDIAKTVLMPGDPLRAKFIAETFLSDVKLVSDVRNVYAYTGKYKGCDVSVMASGMGMPSIGIYSYELFSFYGVENIIRVGSAGAYTADLALYDVVLADSAWSESSYAKTQSGFDSDVIYPDEKLNEVITKAAADVGVKLNTARVHSSDVFYRESNAESFRDINKKYGCQCVEMESFALFHNARVLGKRAACLLTISDNLETHEETTSEERQNAFTDMMKVALEAAINL